MRGPDLIHFRPCLAFLSLAIVACEFGEGDQGGGKKVPSSMTWMSTSLTRTPGAAKRAVSEGISIDTLDNYLNYRLTPSNMEGRLIQASLMVGQPGAGKGGSVIRLVGSENGFQDSKVSNSSELTLFNMADKLTMGSDFKCCWSSYPSDDQAYSGWFEIMFAYVDVSFSIPTGVLAGAHTVRTAFADIGDLGCKRGDIMYKTPDGFRWVDSSTGNLSATRPAKPLKLAWVAEFAGSGDGRGNQHIPTLFVAIQDTQKVHMPADTVLANAWEFVADFILTRGLIFRRTDPAAATTIAEMLGAFDIRADRDNASPGADGISSNFYAIRTPLGMTRPNNFKDSLGNWILPPTDTTTEIP